MQSMGGSKLEDSHFSPESLLVILSALKIVVENVSNPQVQCMGSGNNLHGPVQVNEVNEDSGLPSGSIGPGGSSHCVLSPSPQDVKQSRQQSHG